MNQWIVPLEGNGGMETFALIKSHEDHVGGHIICIQVILICQHKFSMDQIHVSLCLQILTRSPSLQPISSWLGVGK